MRLTVLLFVLWLAHVQSETSSSTSTTETSTTGSTESTTTGPTVSTTTGSTSTASAGSTSTVPTVTTTTGSTVSTTTGSTSTASAGSTSTVPTVSTTTGSTVSTTTGSTSTTSAGSTSTVPTVPTTSRSTLSTTTTGSTSTVTMESTSTSSTGFRTTTIPTTTTVPPRVHCVLEDEPVRLSSNYASPCIVNRFQNHSIQYQSPEFPEKYPNGVECNAKTSSAAPRNLEVTLTLFKLHELDRLVIEGPFRYKKRLGESDLNTTIVLPSAHSKIHFKSNDKKRRKGFKLKVVSKTNKCQRHCELQDGDKGVIKNGPYGSNTFCEWWMEAPAGCFIKLSFVQFDVGTAGSGEAWGCDGDYVGVDRDGDPTYAHPNSRTFCGPTPPSDLRSVANKMNVLFNGRQGGFDGFKAKYEVVCL